MSVYRETLAVLDFRKDQKINVNGVTEAAMRSFIRHQRIGCTSSCIRFYTVTGAQVSAVHISRSWFKEDLIKKLDEREYFFNQS